MIRNSKGSIFYGLHMYPGVAEYAEPGKDAFRIFLNEDTLRKMDPSFAGRPVFVSHVDGVNDSVDELRGEADGWVVESFYNASDGKHWAKLIICSARGEEAVRRKWKLSNCYVPKTFDRGGLWNGVTYAKEVTAGEYEHLAIVPNPRYEESVILTPEEFKRYNESKTEELKRLANEKGESKVKLKWFKREKVENAIDVEQMVFALPKSGRELTVPELVTEFESATEKLSNALTEVATLKAKLATAEATIENAKKKNEEADDDAVDNEDDEDGDEDAKKKKMDADKKKNEEDEKAKKDKEDDDKKKNEEECAKKKNAKDKADRVRNADKNVSNEIARVDFSDTQVARGKARYGA